MSRKDKEYKAKNRRQNEAIKKETEKLIKKIKIEAVCGNKRLNN